MMKIARSDAMDLSFPLMAKFGHEPVLSLTDERSLVAVQLELYGLSRDRATDRLHLDSYFTLTIGVKGETVRAQVLCSCLATFNASPDLVCSSTNCGKTVAAKYGGSRFYHYDSGPDLASWLDSLCCSTLANGLEATLVAADTATLATALNQRFGLLTR